jgi:sugar phosphate isomerase/epimerase
LLKNSDIFIALSSGSLYNYGLTRVFALAREAGFGGMEVLVDMRWDTRQVGYLRELSAKYRLPILSLHAPFQAHSSLIAGWDDDPVEQLKATVRLAEALGARLVVAHPPHGWRLWRMAGRLGPSLHVPLLGLDGYGRWLRQELVAFQETTPVTIAVENMPVHHLGPLPLKLYHLMEVEDLARFAHLTFDTTHWGTWGAGIDLLELCRRFSDKIAHVHLSDYDGRREHRLPGEGMLPLGEVLRELTGNGYSGVVVVEVQPDALAAGEDDTAIVERLRGAYRFCEEHLGDDFA